MKRNLLIAMMFVATAGFAAAQFADMQLGKQGSNQASDQGYGDTMEPPRPVIPVCLDQ